MLSNNKETAVTILRQLGGNRFIAMTGAKHLVALDNGMGCKIGRNASKANYIKITVSSLDLYNIEFVRIHGSKITTIKEVKNLYNDQLKEVFTETTEMYLSL